MCVLLCNVLKVLTLFKYHGDIAKKRWQIVYVAVFSLILLPRLSRHLHGSCYTLYLWRLNVHDICFVRFPELCLFFEIGISIWRKFVSQTSSTVFKSSLILFLVVLLSFDKVEIGGILITISDSSIFNR